MNALVILKIALQVVTVALAILASILDYKWHDKRTTKFKTSRNLLYVMTGVLLVLSIGVTVGDDIENNKREQKLSTDLKKVQDQNDGLQAGIAALTGKSSDMLEEQRNSFLSLLEDQRRIGLQTSGTITTAADLLQANIKKTIAQQKKTLENITGGEGFCYLRLLIDNDTAQLVVVPQGNAPLYGVHVRLWEPKNYQNIPPGQFREVMKGDYVRVIGDLSPYGVVLLEPGIQLAGATVREFSVDIGARNGFVKERIKALKIDGIWRVAYRVTKQVGLKNETLFEEIDPILKGKLNW
jgi:hypothetical protein